MQSLLQAGPSFHVKAKRCCIYSEICKWLQQKFELLQRCFFPRFFSSNYSIVSGLKNCLVCSFFLILFYFSHVEFSIFPRPSMAQFLRRFKFLPKRINFLFSASPLLPFPRRNTVNLQTRFPYAHRYRKEVMHRHISRMYLGIRYTKEIDLHACLTKLKLLRWLDTSNADNIATYITALATDPWPIRSVWWISAGLITNTHPFLH